MLSGGHNGVGHAVRQFDIHNLRWNLKRAAERAGLPAPTCFDLPLLFKAKKAGLQGLELPVTDLRPTEEKFLYDYSSSRLLAFPKRLDTMKEGEWEQLVLRAKGVRGLAAWQPALPQVQDLITSPTPQSQLPALLCDLGRAILARVSQSTPGYAPAASPGAISPSPLPW